MMFNMQNFVMSTLTKMIEHGEVDYRVMQYASTWYWRGTLDDENMSQIETLLSEREAAQTPPEPPIEEEDTPTENGELE